MLRWQERQPILREAKWHCLPMMCGSSQLEACQLAYSIKQTTFQSQPTPLQWFTHSTTNLKPMPTGTEKIVIFWDSPQLKVEQQPRHI